MNQTGLADGIDLSVMLRRACDVAGGQTAFAESVGVSVAFINAVLSAKKSPSPKILTALGMKRIVRYVPVKAAA